MSIECSISQIRSLPAEQIANACHSTSSTIVENPLQIGPIMQNKPNFKIGKMNATFFTTKPYQDPPLRRLPENKPNTNPNKPNFKRQISVFCSLESIVWCLQSVLRSRTKPKFLNFHLKNSLTVRSNSLKYLLSCGK